MTAGRMMVEAPPFEPQEAPSSTESSLPRWQLKKAPEVGQPRPT